MKTLDLKIVTSTLALMLGSLTSFSSAAQIQGFISGYAPGDVDVKEDAKGKESNLDYHSDFTWSLGAEFLVSPVSPLVVGGGLGFFSVQKDGDANIVMPAIPLWGSVGVIGPEKWTARPYFEARIGYPLPAATFATWWRKPLNFYVGGNVGVQLPYHMGVEFNCTYLTMDKYFKDEDINYRMSSLKFGGSITVHFDLFKSSSESDKSPAKNENPYAEQATENFSYGYTATEVNENPEAAPSEEPSYTGYGEQSAEAPVTEEPAPEAVPAEEQPAEPVAEEVAEPAPVESETPEAEAPAEEPAAEPAPEPEPEPKPVAKKATSKKKTAKKKTTKKTTTKAKSKKKKK